MNLRLFIALFSSSLILSCTQEDYDKAIAEQARVSTLRHSALDSANRKKIPYLKDFLIIYPESIVRYLSFADSDFPSLSVTTTLHNRYELNMRIPVNYSDDNREVVGYGFPRCFLLEIESVDPRDDGRGGTELGGTSVGNLQKHFGDKEWQSLFESNGDFSVLGYELDKKSPVKNFELVIKHQKSLERIIPVKPEG